MFRSLLSKPIIKRPFTLNSNVLFESSNTLKPKIFLKQPNFLTIASLRSKSKHHSESNLKNVKEQFQKSNEGQKTPEISPELETSSLGRVISFSLITSTFILAVAAHLYQKESSEEKTEGMIRRLFSIIPDSFGFNDKFINTEPPNFESEINSSFNFLSNKINIRMKGLQEEWNALSRDEKAIWGIIGLNIAIFVLWKIPSFDSFMTRHFCHLSKSDRHYTMLTSCFSHCSLIHLGLNCMMLHNLGQIASWDYTPEHLVAFYLTAGILSSLTRTLASYLPKVFSRINFMIPTHGASGAVYGIMSIIAYNRPHIEVWIPFLPGFQFEFQNVLAFAMAFDLLGILRGWNLIDHIAHLGGALFGLVYAKWGTEYIWIPINSAVLHIKNFYHQYIQ